MVGGCARGCEVRIMCVFIRSQVHGMHVQNRHEGLVGLGSGVSGLGLGSWVSGVWVVVVVVVVFGSGV